MQPAEPTQHHHWLLRLVGSWTFESECVMGPDQPLLKSSGSEVVRALGPLWVIGEGRGSMPGGQPSEMMITLGYDPAQDRFVGTWIGSMMTNMWVYRGSLDPAGRVLTLETEGPGFDGSPSAAYRDTFEILAPDHRVLRSSTLGADGKWTTFMTAHYRRKS